MKCSGLSNIHDGWLQDAEVLGELMTIISGHLFGIDLVQASSWQD